MFHSIHTKTVVAFVAVLFATASIVLVTSYAHIQQHEHELMESMGLAAAQECANAIEIAYDQGSGGEFVPGTSDYDSCLEYLRNLCLVTGMNYLYVCKYDIENDTITYIMAVGASDDENEAITRDRPYGTVIHDGIDDVEMRALAGEEVKEALETDNQFGHMLDWVSPVREMGNDVLAGASYSMTEQRQREMVNAWSNLLPFVIAFLLLFVVEILILRKSVFKPLRAIAGRMRSFSAESTDAPEPLGITSKDEIGDIAEAFENMAGDIGEYVSRIERLAAEKARATYELDVARRIQQGMVPERTETAGAGFSVCGFSRPARQVGGDFYDVIQLEDGRIAIAVGDASGKGIAAALFMIVTKTILRDGLLAGFGPADVLNHANERLASENPEGMFVSVFACVFDPVTGEVRYANAGHMPPLLVGGASILKVDPGELLGVFDDVVIEEASIVLEPGQGLLVYTDGAVEARSADGSFFGERRFADSVGTHVPYADAGALVDEAVHAVDQFVEEHEQFDDLTFAAIMFDEPGDGKAPDASGSSSSYKLSCDMAAFQKLREALFATSADDELKRKACLACEEAFANIVSYSGAMWIWAEVAEEPGRLRVQLADDGAPFDPLAAGPADKEFEDLDSGGMGINLVRQLAAHLEYRREGNRNVLVIVV